jgi:ribose transport system substrate-binding protein
MTRLPSFGRNRRRTIAVCAVLVAGVALAACSSSSSSTGSNSSTGSAASSGGGSSFKITYSNSYLGNTFHQVLIKDAQTTASDAEKQGLISHFTITDANSSPTTQAQQIRNDIVQGYNAIIVDASSGTALNSAIQEACAHGILVIAANEVVTAPCAYNIEINVPIETKLQMESIGQALNGKGNVLDDQGIAGTLPEAQFLTGVQQGLKEYPGLKIVGHVYGQWTTTITDQQISQALPSLPSIQAVVSEGAGEVGVVQAFKAANRPVPLVYFGNAGQDLRTWAGLIQTNPNYHVWSISSFPDTSGFAIYAALAMLQHKVHLDSKAVWFPILQIKQNYLQQWIAATPVNSQADFQFTYPETVKLLGEEPNVPAVIAPPPGGPIPGL